MAGIQELVGTAVALVSLLATGFTLGAALALNGDRERSRRRLPRRPAVPVTILKPLHREEPGLDDNLRTFLRQDYDGAVQLVFGVSSSSDPALAVVGTLRREFPDAHIDVVVGSKSGATNPKVANLMNMVAHARHELLVVSDSDIRVGPEYLRRIVAEFDDPQLGAVSLLYSGTPLGNVWSKLAAMNIDCHFLPNARLGMTLGLAHPCFGSTIALRRRMLEDIGGFETISNVLADDYELGRAIRSRGYRVLIPNFTVEHICGETDVLTLFQQELRWAKTNFLLARVGYIGSVVTHPLPLALLSFVFQGITPLSLSVLAWALASRLFLVFKVDRRLGSRGDYIWLLPLRDTISFLVYLASFFGKSVEWRGRRFATRSDGALAPVWR